MSEKNMKLMNRISGKGAASKATKRVWKGMTSKQRKSHRNQILRELREPDRTGHVWAIGGAHRRKNP